MDETKLKGLAGPLLVLLAACTGEPWPDPPPISAEEHRATHDEWRQGRRDGLVTPPYGAVIWAGLHELAQGPNPLGSDPALAIALPPGDAPHRAGVLVREGQNVRLEPAPGAGFRLEDGTPVDAPLDLVSDRSDEPTTLALGSLGMRVHGERGTDRLWLRTWDADSPLIETFALPEAYPLAPEWRVAARFDPFPEPREMYVPDVTGGMVAHPVPGELVVHVGGREHRLLASADSTSTTYFLMIWDSTATTTTYEAGRYLRAPIADSTGWTVLDFNRSYNPACVFSDYSVCGFPPPENRLPFAVTAGEMRASAQAVAVERDP